jgi:hypothetical protein
VSPASPREEPSLSLREFHVSTRAEQLFVAVGQRRRSSIGVGAVGPKAVGPHQSCDKDRKVQDAEDSFED